MQKIMLLTLLALAELGGASDLLITAAAADRTVTKVVKLLEDMLKQSKIEEDSERDLYAKFKCYCDTTEADRRTSMAKETKNIKMYQAKIDGLQASNGELSARSESLKDEMDKNTADQAEAKSLHDKTQSAYNSKKADLTQAIAQMRQALSTLAAVGADQTESTGADQKQFMGGFKGSALLDTQSSMQSALETARAYMNEKQYNSAMSFMQAPFTGTYTSQSGGVLGIVKQMADTFTADLKTATDDENARVKAYNAQATTLKAAHAFAKKIYGASQATMGTNDDSLANDFVSLKNAESMLQSHDEFLNGNAKAKEEGLLKMCSDKAADFDKRSSLRTNEDAAITQAVSILDSDDAFATFATTSATTTGATQQNRRSLRFLQISQSPDTAEVRATVQRLLQRAAHKQEQPLTKHVMSALDKSTLEKKSSFDAVFEDIDRMIAVIASEGTSDDQKLSWCNAERKENEATKASLFVKINAHKGKVNNYFQAINDVGTGDKDSLATAQEALSSNLKDQATFTTARAAENVLYQKDIKNLVAAQALLKNGVKVLAAYYDQITSNLLQSDESDKAAPGTWKNDSYSGQSGKGGNAAIKMLEFVLAETSKEEMAAHDGERASQHTYEDEMTKDKKEQAKYMKDIASVEALLASDEKNLLTNRKHLKGAKASHATTMAYLAEIKPGCDFITSNIALRKKNRAAETNSLEQAKATMKASPLYKAR